MKKTFVITALVVGLGFIGLQQASARGMGGFHGMGGQCLKGGPGYSQLDEASKAKVDKFYGETQDLRKQMVMKSAEERALMSSTNPDSGKVAKLAGELFDLKTTLQAKAEAAGVQELMGCGVGCQGPGKGMRPHHGGGRGMMNAGPDGDSAATDAPAGADAQ
ncbi:MAG: periplasmic heavy metal sensor [Desulfoarculaceae bacterium]|nr:periplasmic heavy metal sensor [Desulfoarculaceae bacterium]